jgi:hypothetical protein
LVDGQSDEIDAGKNALNRRRRRIAAEMHNVDPACDERLAVRADDLTVLHGEGTGAAACAGWAWGLHWYRLPWRGLSWRRRRRCLTSTATVRRAAAGTVTCVAASVTASVAIGAVVTVVVSGLCCLGAPGEGRWRGAGRGMIGAGTGHRGQPLVAGGIGQCALT